MFANLLRLAAVLVLFALPATAQDATSLKAGLALMRGGDWDGALEAAGPEGSVARDIVQWNRLRASKGSFPETLDFLRRRPDWPGIALLRERSEETIPEDTPYATILDYFLLQKPETGTGILRFAHALWETGAKQEAMAEAIRGWTNMSLSDEEFAGFRVDWPKTTQAYHEKRLDMLLWRGLSGEAEQMFGLVSPGWQALAKARIALRDDKPGVDALIEAVPASLANDPGLAFERMQWRARKGRNDDAAALVLERSGSAESLGRPGAWSGWRLALARAAMREGKGQTAYRLAAQHHLPESDGDRNELEWLAGYVALTLNNDPQTALTHFKTFATGVDSPISLGRAGYWQGRALEALGRPDEAKAAYTRGGQHQTSFYGLLAAEKAGVPEDARLVGTDTHPGYRDTAWWSSSVMEAARLSLAAGEMYYARRFVVQLSERLDRQGLGQLTQWAEDANAPYLALAVAKYALDFHGELLRRAYYPTPEIGRGARIVPRALEMAISRRESEFNPGATSGVGARGLMQLMPGTARDMAKRIGIDYEAGRLVEMAYNTRLGSEYLAYLIETFGNNPVLIAAAYNAGPGRAKQWIEALGDPRAPGVDVVDWIEHIPFNETRNYVMRVTESLPAYRARLTGQVEPIRFLEELKRR